MPEETIDSTVADPSTTPGAAESVEPTEQTSDDATGTTTDQGVTQWEGDVDSVWNSVGEGDDEKAEDEGKDEQPAGAETPAPEGEGKVSDPESTTDLENLFSDDPEAPAADEKPAATELEEKPKEEAPKTGITPEEIQAALQSMTPEELLDRQKNKYAKDWANRNLDKANIVKDFQFAEKPITEVVSKLAEINPERFAELSQHAAHQLVDANPEATFRRAYAVAKTQQDPSWDPATGEYPAFADLVAGKVAPVTAAAGSTTEISEVTKALDELFEGDAWRDPARDDETALDDREKTLLRAVRDLEAKAAQASTARKEKAELEEKLKGYTEQTHSTEKAEIQRDLMTEITSYRSSIEAEILPAIFKTSGLAESPDDTPEVASFKKVRQEWFSGTPYEKANNLPSRFETFAEGESTVKDDLIATYTRIVDAQVKQIQAQRAGKTDEAARHRAAAADERSQVTLLLATATKEFRERYLKPDLALLGKVGAKAAEPIKRAQKRVEVVSTGGGAATPTPKKRDYINADDVWNSMPAEEAEADRLRAAGA